MKAPLEVCGPESEVRQSQLAARMGTPSCEKVGPSQAVVSPKEFQVGGAKKVHLCRRVIMMVVRSRR